MVEFVRMTAPQESTAAYEAADGSELPMLIFEPAEGTRSVAGIVMFHGGGLRQGSAEDLAPHCRELASRGLFAVSAGYRLLRRGARGIDDCIADVRLAVGHFSKLAARRGLDQERLASGGSSAGAHLALVAALIAPDRPGPAADPGVAAIVALNPVVDLLGYPPEYRRSLEQEVGIPAGRAIDYSPVEFVRPGNPPVLIQHGTRDEIAPIAQPRRFRDAMVAAGNDCVLVEYEGAEHGFHYPATDGRFADVIEATGEFLLDRIASR